MMERKTPTKDQLNDPSWWDANVRPSVAKICIETDARGGLVAIHKCPSEDTVITLSHPDNDVDFYFRPAESAWRPGDPCRVLLPFPVGLWCDGRVIGRDGEQYVVKVDGHYSAVGPDEIKPERTKAERERKEAVNHACKEVYMRVSDDHLVRTIRGTVAALYDAGLLRKGGE